MPRLSVDIDLAYLSLEPRETALPKIRAALARIGEQLMASSPAIATTGLIERTPSPTDGRSLLVRLTKKVERLLTRRFRKT